MSEDIQHACLTALGDGPSTIDDLAEGIGYERLQVAQAMQALKQAGAVYSGRGGWRPVDESGETPRLAAAAVVVHEAVEPVADAPKRRGRPRLATVAQLTGHAIAPPRRYEPPADDYAFAISEAGELLVTTADAAKFASFSPETTARLAAFLSRYQALLPGNDARAA